MKRNDIIRFRATHNLSQPELGELLGGLDYKTISNYERGYVYLDAEFREKMQALIDEFGIDDSIPHDINYYHKTNYKKKKPQKQQQKEEVATNKPPASEHYHDSIDPIAFAEANYGKDELIGFYRINAIKYIARYGAKEGFNDVDLDKAIFYINKLKEVDKS
jgi:transcriptional regulator with XRE-family HTH domain